MRRAHRREPHTPRRPPRPPGGARWWHYLLVALLAVAATALAAGALMHDYSPIQRSEQAETISAPAPNSPTDVGR